MSTYKNTKTLNGTNKNSSQVSQIKAQQNNTTFGDQINTINGTGEINYNQTTQSNQNQNGRTGGPQLTFDKNYLCMKAIVGDIEQDQVVVTNVGSTTVTYIWKKVQRGDYIQSKCSDGIQRFYCHYPKSILKPGESKTFIFSFRSDTKPGIFFEEWELLTEPMVLQPLPLINLSGMATKADDFISTKVYLRGEWDNFEKNRICQELYEELFNSVPIKADPAPNMRDSEIFKKHFEENNKHLGLYFTQGIMNQLYELLEDIQGRINDGQDYITPWDTKIEYLEDLITKVSNPYSRDLLKDRYVRLLSQAKKVPTDRAQSYNVFRKMLLDLSEHTVEFEQKGREELQMIENMGFIVPHENQTEEEVKKLEEEKKAKKADWMKKLKKKPKTEEEENQEMDELKNKVSNGLKSELLNQKIDKAEQDVDFVKTKWLFDNHLKMDENQYDEIYRLESILDIDISGKDLILRLDLDVPLSPYVPPPPLSQSHTLDDHQKSQFNTRTKKTAQQLQQEALLLQQQQQSLAQHEDPWRKRDILDHTLIKKATTDIRYCIEHLANRTFIMGNLGEKCGKIKPENSMKIIFNVLQQQLIEQQMIFIPDAIIKDFEHRKENEEFPESTAFMLENLNFKPDEFGYVEPDKPPEEAKPTEEELKKEEELKQQQLAAQQKAAGGKTGGKTAPADKKKAEEEAKKKAEEEAAMKKKMEAMAAEKQISEEERLEQQRLKEEAERKKREMEYFDYKTIHRFKEHLGKYGDIYVNDAPMMTLTSSNSINEIKCKKRVMGVRMTEEIRKICLFFMKKLPSEIQNMWYQAPTYQPYHAVKFTVLLGGCFKSFQELLDKVLLLNSLVDTAQSFYLYGELGLAALYALDIKLGRVERTQDNYKDYDKTKEFFLNIFERIILAGKKLYLPYDFLVSQKYEIEDSQMHTSNIQEDQLNNTQLSAVQQQQLQKTTQQQMLDKTQQSKLNLSQQQDDDVTKKSGNLHQQQQQQQQWRPYHWADKIIAKEKHRYVKIQELYYKKWNELVEKLWPKYVEIYKPELYGGYYHSTNYYGYIGNYFNDNNYDQGEPIESDDYILEFGQETRDKINSLLEESFKVLWDGSISLFKDAVHASLSNKIFVQKLLEVRTRTQMDEEPPVTLLHGNETETVVRHSIMRLKVEQQEALEAQKRKAALEGEEVEEEEEQITMTQDESKEEASTIHQDMMQIADFLCFDIPQFTLKLMQGVPNKALYNLDQHPKKTKDQEEEDLFLLDEI